MGLMDLEPSCGPSSTITYPIVNDISSQGSYDRCNRLELKTYSRRNKEPVLTVLPQQPCSNPSSPNDPNGNNGNMSVENCDINLPIALKKEVGSYTQHFISNFVS